MEKYDFSNYKFRASMFGDLMSGAKDITEKQKQLIETLSNKETLTVKQEETLQELISKRDNIELSKGAKTLLRKLRREVKFKRRREINSKYLTKGIELEEEAIDWLSMYHDQVFTNNKERRENEYFSGECDIVEGYDTKVAWSMDTLPDPEEPLPPVYEYQNRIYMMLWNKDKWTTSAIAISMLEDHIRKALYGEAWKWDNNEIPDWRKIEIIKYYCYEEEYFVKMLTANDIVVNKESDEKAIDMFMDFVEIPMNERIVEKTVTRDKDIERKMIQIAKLARKYMQDLEDNL
jgi:hypothetical protein